MKSTLLCSLFFLSSLVWAQTPASPKGAVTSTPTAPAANPVATPAAADAHTPKGVPTSLDPLRQIKRSKSKPKKHSVVKAGKKSNHKKFGKKKKK